MQINIHIFIKYIFTKKKFYLVQKLIRLGARSRVKDASAVLERIPNPQWVKLYRFPSSVHFELTDNLHNPDTLM